DREPLLFASLQSDVESSAQEARPRALPLRPQRIEPEASVRIPRARLGIRCGGRRTAERDGLSLRREPCRVAGLSGPAGCSLLETAKADLHLRFNCRELRHDPARHVAVD